MTRHVGTSARWGMVGCCLAVGILLGAGGRSEARAQRPAPRRNAPSLEPRLATYSNLRLSFEENRGQTDARVKFLAHAGSATLFLTQDEIVLAADQSVPVRMRFVGSNAASSVAGLEPLPAQTNYFIGNKPQNWHTRVPTYAKVHYRQLYRGIDLAVYGDRQQLEYDLIAAPGANLNDIRLRFDGAKRVEVDAAGDLVVHMQTGELRHHKPVIYQDADGVRRSINGGYVINGRHEVGVRVAKYDRTKSVTVDPVLMYSTYLGGDNADTGLAIATDADGNVYVTGKTTSANFPTVNPVQPQRGSLSGDAFVAKLTPSGTALVFATFLGGSGPENVHANNKAGIAVDHDGNVYLTGSTFSSDFPLQNPAQQATVFTASGEAFVTKLDSSGAALVYSTYLGGSSAAGEGIAVDAHGNAYVAGVAGEELFSIPDTLFPTTPGAYQTRCDVVPLCNSSTLHGFITKYDANGQVIYSTLLGGDNNDEITAVAVDADGNAYVTGETGSETGFPTSDAVQPKLADSSGDAFVAKVDPSGAHLLYFTYLGGAGDPNIFGTGTDAGYGIAVDADGNAYVVGQTAAHDFPTTSGVVQPTLNTSCTLSAFLAKLNPTASALTFSTFLGGFIANNLALDREGNAYVVGTTGGSPCEVSPVQPLQTLGGNGAGGTTDAFVTVVNPTGASLLFSTPLGGSSSEMGYGIAVDPRGNIYMTGTTASTDFPTVHPLKPQLGPTEAANAFVAKISPAVHLPPPGDANCDRNATAADLTALVLLVGNHLTPACSTADANGDGMVNQDDLPDTIEAVFNSGA